MGRNILKSTGRIIFSLIFVFFCNVLYAVEIETELSPSSIEVGETAALRIKITGKSSEVKPVKFPAINGLQIDFSGSSRNFQFINGRTWSGTVLSFSVSGRKKGKYKIPPFIFKVDGQIVSSREVMLTVQEPSGRGNSFQGDIELSSQTVFAGEPVIMRYFLHGDGDPAQIEGFSEKPHTKGFVMKEFTEKSEPGGTGRTYIGNYCLVPVENGVHEIGGGSVLEITIERIQGFFSMSGRRKIIFPYKKINVIPLPLNGKSDSFKGDVGEFRIETEVPSGTFRSFEEIKIPVKVSGRGNFLSLSKPQIENEEGIKTVIEEKEESLSITGTNLTGEKNFIVTIIPQREGTVKPGRIFIEFFNPYKRIYERGESAPLNFEVQSGSASGEKDEVRLSPENSASRGRSLLIVTIVILALAAAVILLVMWERKKLNLIKEELNPEPAETPDASAWKEDDGILKNLQAAYNGKNKEMFYLYADRGINRIDTSKLPESDRLKYNTFKDKIYHCRYGGSDITETEMHELNEWLKKKM